MTVHILWKESKEEFWSKGKNYEADNVFAALDAWQTEFPGMYFMAMYIKE